MMLKGKKILIGITGSIAAYKIILLVRLLIKQQAEVKIILTPAAKDFVSPLVLATLSKQKVYCSLTEDDEWTNHVELGRWADLMIIAPLSCNTLAKMAMGICDNLLLATYLSATCKVVAAPAMDEDMWHHPSTQRNLQTIQQDGVGIIPVSNGELASGLFGEGRMAEPEEIIEYIITNYFRKSILKGKKVLITAGPTYEHLDPVRFIGNHSSGKMGFALAETFFELGADVLVIHGYTTQALNYQAIQRIGVISADEMYEQTMKNYKDYQIIIMAAAVADYKPVQIASEKIKKSNDAFTLELIKNKDILKEVGANKSNHQILIGFALETNNEMEHAQKKLIEKNADYILLNSLKDPDAGFNKDTNKIIILNKNKKDTYTIELNAKKHVAEQIATYIIHENFSNE